LSQQATTSNELPSLEEPEVQEKFETIKPAQEEKEEPTTIDTVSNQPLEITVSEQTPQSSGFQCPHYFGYLSKRSKGEVIPEICFECPKSIECMLSVYNTSKENMEEIKKWYPF
jgi:hypothetical protein